LEKKTHRRLKKEREVHFNENECPRENLPKKVHLTAGSLKGIDAADFKRKTLQHLDHAAQRVRGGAFISRATKRAATTR